jgi:hypothetical protein
LALTRAMLYEVASEPFRAVSMLMSRPATANAEWVRDEAHFDTLVDRRFGNGGPCLLAVRIDDQPSKLQTMRDPALIRNRFMKGLGTGRGGALDAGRMQRLAALLGSSHRGLRHR